MAEPLCIFMGFDSREIDAYNVAKWSIERRASRPVLISPLYLPHLGRVHHRRIEMKEGQMWCPISNAPMSTEFANSRFVVPFIQRSGWALFMDCDVLCLSDIAELFALADPRYAVMVVKHQHDQIAEAAAGQIGTKMDGQLQTFYRRKNWSSVVLWNLDHPAKHKLSNERFNCWPGRQLHAFDWLEDDEIGELPASWNHLVGIDTDERADILHYTLGGPWIPNWKGGPMDHRWLAEQREMLGEYPTKRTAASRR